MIHEIEPHSFNNQFKNDAVLSDDSLIFVFGKENEPSFGGRAVLTKDSRIPRFSDFSGVNRDSLTFLFNIDGNDCFLLRESRPEFDGEEKGFVFRSFRHVRNVQDIPKYEHFLAMTAFQLHNWYKNNTYCGQCGSETVLSEKERAMICPKCGRTIYPRIVPAVTVAIIDRERDKILLTQYAGRDFTFYALVAGFTEIGETLEETVKREAMEETGLKVKNIRYYGSQPWGIVDNIMVGFYCELDGSNEIHRDAEELKLADWFSREEVELQPTDMSLTNNLMKAFKEGRI
ncbi:MAG: NAD(+) diphosphatase [Lachnospiraceae bacterium]|nr:NAD(+) diphosphatase [Lachnospiraceae bacterium]